MGWVLFAEEYVGVQELPYRHREGADGDGAIARIITNHDRGVMEGDDEALQIGPREPGELARSDQRLEARHLIADP